MKLEDFLFEIAKLKEHKWAPQVTMHKLLDELELKVRKAMSAAVNMIDKPVETVLEIEDEPKEKKSRKQTTQKESVYIPGGGIETPKPKSEGEKNDKEG